MSGCRHRNDCLTISTFRDAGGEGGKRGTARHPRINQMDEEAAVAQYRTGEMKARVFATVLKKMPPAKVLAFLDTESSDDDEDEEMHELLSVLVM